MQTILRLSKAVPLLTHQVMLLREENKEATNKIVYAIENQTEILRPSHNVEVNSHHYVVIFKAMQQGQVQYHSSFSCKTSPTKELIKLQTVLSFHPDNENVNLYEMTYRARSISPKITHIARQFHPDADELVDEKLTAFLIFKFPTLLRSDTATFSAFLGRGQSRAHEAIIRHVVSVCHRTFNHTLIE